MYRYKNAALKVIKKLCNAKLLKESLIVVMVLVYLLLALAIAVVIVFSNSVK